jgi:hypothetical protein
MPSRRNERLIAEIADRERLHAAREPYRDYARWQAALERPLVEKGLCSAAELDVRKHALASRRDGRDHRLR